MPVLPRQQAPRSVFGAGLAVPYCADWMTSGFKITTGEGQVAAIS